MTLTVLAGNNYTVSGHVVIPASNYNGQLEVNVKVNDGISDSNTFAIPVTINAVNDAPMINAASAIQTNEDSTLVISRAQFDITDVDNNANELVLTLHQGDNYQINGNQLTPNQNFFGTLTATVTVSDGIATSAPFDFNISVIAVNDPPVLAPITTITISEDSSATISIDDLNVQDPDNLSSELTPVIAEGDNYSVSYQQNSATITPAADFNGQLTIAVQVSDAMLSSDAQTLTLIVTPVNDNPVANNDSFIVNQASDNNILDVLANDTDIDGDTLTLSAVDYNGSGIISIENNSLTYNPSNDFSGQESFTYTLSDGNGGQTQGSVTVTVNPTPSTPSDNSGSSGSGGGGSLGIWMLLALALLHPRLRPALTHNNKQS